MWIWLLHVLCVANSSTHCERHVCICQMLLLDNIPNAAAVYQSSIIAGLQAGVPAEALHHAASQGVSAEALRAAVS